jgi:hypothetical protein
MDTLALKTRAIAQVQVLAQAWEMLQQTWNEIQAIGDERRDVLDRMLCDHYPFSESFDDIDMDAWCKAVTNYDIKPEPETAEDAGKTYLFVDGLYQGEFNNSDDAAIRACELMNIDPTEMKNSGEDWSTWLYDHSTKNCHEIVHEADYRFAQGDNHPANRMELKSFWNEFVDAEFACGDDRWYKGKHRPSIRWNGFACPYFDFETSKAILEGLGDDSKVHYDETRDMWVHAYMTDEEVEYEGLLFDGVKMYAIGAFNWTWVVKSEEQQPENKIYNLINADDLLKSPITDIEMHACRQEDDHVTQCDDDEKPDFYSVYVRYLPTNTNAQFGGIECIADCSTYEAARDLKKLIETICARMVPKIS